MPSKALTIAADSQTAAAPLPSAGESADRALATWRGIDAVLTPIVGRRGADALFRRALQLTQVDHPVLAFPEWEATAPEGYTALQTLLAAQTDLAAAVASQALLRHFQALLERLIGSSLTRKLLGPLLENPSRGPAAEDESP